jgi:hypothetical protein
MAIIATSEATSNIPLIETGSYPATCFKMIHVGTVSDEFEGKPTKANKVILFFEFPTEMYKFKEDSEEEPRILNQEFTLSLGAKSKLLPFLNSWRGKPFTAEEAAAFDVSKLIGVPCFISIGSKVSKKGKEFNYIVSALSLPKGMPAPAPIREQIEVNYQNLTETFGHVPAYIREKMELTPEYLSQSFRFPIEGEAIEAVEGEEVDAVAEDETVEAVPGKKLPF